MHATIRNGKVKKSTVDISRLISALLTRENYETGKKLCHGVPVRVEEGRGTRLGARYDPERVRLAYARFRSRRVNSDN